MNKTFKDLAKQVTESTQSYQVLTNAIHKSVMMSEGTLLHKVTDRDLGIEDIRNVVGESLALDVNDLETLVTKGLIKQI